MTAGQGMFDPSASGLQTGGQNVQVFRLRRRHLDWSQAGSVARWLIVMAVNKDSEQWPKVDSVHAE